MASRVCLVHYHEIGLKGKNRARFERILMDNLKAALAAFSVATINRISGHILVAFSVPGEAERAWPLMARVPGVARVPEPDARQRGPYPDRAGLFDLFCDTADNGSACRDI